MKYKGIIFDLDGVLCSTDRFHFEAWKQTAEEVGAPFDETINMKLRGVSRMESLEIILSGSSKTFTDAEKERLATEKNDRYRKLLAQMSPADMPAAVRDALTALHNAGLKLAVGSSSKNAAYILERLDANHSSDQHPWFIESRSGRDNPKRDYYIWKDPAPDGGAPNNWRSCFSGSAWKYDEKTAQYYLHLFAEGQPDLNWENPEVRDQVFDMMNFWFQKGIDGFRMDVISMISKAGYADGPLCADGLYGDYTDQCTNGPRVHEYLQEMNRRVLSHYDCMTVGENANVNPELACLYAGEDCHELNMVFQFELMDVDGGESRKWEPEHPWKLTDIKKIQTRWQTGLDGKAWNSLYWNNHDQPRVVSRFGCTKDEESRVRSAKMLAVCLYLMQGTPYICFHQSQGYPCRSRFCCRWLHKCGLW